MTEEFKKRQEKLRKLVLDFEMNLSQNNKVYYDSEYYEKIIKWYIDNHKFKKGLDAANFAIFQHSYSSDLLFLKANILVAMQKFKESLEMLDKAYLLNPTDENIFILKGQVFVILGRIKKALKVFKSAIRFSSNKDELYYQIGLAYKSSERYKKALKYFKKAVNSNISHENALNDLAECFNILGETKKSIKFYKKFIDQDPYSEFAWFNLAKVYYNLKKYNKSIKAYEYSITINDEFSSAYLGLGEAYKKIKKFKKATKIFETIYELDGPGFDIYYHLGNIYFLRNEYDISIKFFQKALKEKEFHLKSLIGIGKSLSSIEKWHEAIHYFRKAISIEGDNIICLKFLAKAEFEIGNIISSKELFNEALKLNQNDKDIYLDYSFIYYSNDNFEKSIEIIENGINELPKESILYYRLVIYLLKAGRYKESISVLESALSINFNNHYILFEFLPELNENSAFYRIINQFKENRL